MIKRGFIVFMVMWPIVTIGIILNRVELWTAAAICIGSAVGIWLKNREKNNN